MRHVFVAALLLACLLSAAGCETNGGIIPGGAAVPTPTPTPSAAHASPHRAR